MQINIFSNRGKGVASDARQASRENNWMIFTLEDDDGDGDDGKGGGDNREESLPQIANSISLRFGNKDAMSNILSIATCSLGFAIPYT